MIHFPNVGHGKKLGSSLLLNSSVHGEKRGGDDRLGLAAKEQPATTRKGRIFEGQIAACNDERRGGFLNVKKDSLDGEQRGKTEGVFYVKKKRGEFDRKNREKQRKRSEKFT